MKRLATAAITAALTAVPATASAFETDSQVWAAAFVQFPIASKLRGMFETQTRWVDGFDRFDRLILRGAVNWNFGHGLTAWAGYGWTPGFDPEFRDEQRPWQQLQHQLDRNEVTFIQRLRFEERFIEDVSGPSFRARYQARFVHRPAKWHGFGVVVWDELFLNLNTKQGGPRGGIDQNRFGLGMQYAVSKALIFEPTYVLNTYYRGPAREGRIAHTALGAVWITL